MNKHSIEQLFNNKQGKMADKWQYYLREYDKLFLPFRDRKIRLLEIGIFNGGSLEIWSEYFSNCDGIVGVDINPACARLQYSDPKIQVFIGDANETVTRERIREQCSQFDIIIDDGSHASDDIIRSFCYYFPLLSNGGIYVVEDLHASYWLDFKGGLFEHVSSMSFFKRLTDVLNQEHWRTGFSRKAFLLPFEQEYGVQFDEDVLSGLHRVEFLNSLCIIEKAPAEQNQIGNRTVSGSDVVIQVEQHVAFGMSIRDVPIRVKNDEEMDVFGLMRSLSTAQLESEGLKDKLDQSKSDLAVESAEKTARQEELSRVYASKSWRYTRFFRQLAGRSKILNSLNNLQNYRLVKNSGLFDVDFYLFTNPDVKAAGTDPLWHYLRFGGKEGRAAAKDFDSAFYLSANPDVRVADINPLVHYIRCGKKEGRKTSPSQGVEDG